MKSHKSKMRKPEELKAIDSQLDTHILEEELYSGSQNNRRV